MNLSTELHPCPKPQPTPKTKKPMRKRVTKRTRAKEFSPAIRRIVMERSGGKCELCHMRPITHFHHAVFRSAGGNGELSNAIGLCYPCHSACHATRAMRDHAVELASELARR